MSRRTAQIARTTYARTGRWAFWGGSGRSRGRATIHAGCTRWTSLYAGNLQQVQVDAPRVHLVASVVVKADIVVVEIVDIVVVAIPNIVVVVALVFASLAAALLVPCLLGYDLCASGGLRDWLDRWTFSPMYPLL